MLEQTFELRVPVANCTESTWLKLNLGHAVPSRVAYPSNMLDRLASAVRSGAMQPADRAGLLSDMFALTRSGHASPADVMRLLGAYTNERNPIVWQSISAVVNGLHKVLMEEKEILDNFNKFAVKLVLPLMEYIGWEAKESDGHLDKILRATAISLAGSFCAEGSVLTEARKRFDAIIEDPENAQACPSEYKTSVFKIVMRAGGKDEFSKLRSLFAESSANVEKVRILQSLGYVSDLKLKREVLDWSVSGEVKLQDFFYPMGSVSTSDKEGRDLTFEFFKENFAHIRQMLSRAIPSLMDAVIVYCCGGFSSEDKANEIESFFADKDFKGNQRKIQQVLENTRTSHVFLQRILQSEMGKTEFWASL